MPPYTAQDVRDLANRCDSSTQALTARCLRDYADVMERAGWRDISEAPKDGTWIIIAGPFGVDFAAWQEGYPEQRECGVITDPGCAEAWAGNLDLHSPDAPTHFQPLPDPPSPASEAQESEQ